MIYREDIERAAKTVQFEMKMVEQVLKEPQKKERLREWEHVLKVLRFYYKKLPALQRNLILSDEGET